MWWAINVINRTTTKPSVTHLVSRGCFRNLLEAIEKGRKNTEKNERRL
jgi:hypothetical protein